MKKSICVPHSCLLANIEVLHLSAFTKSDQCHLFSVASDFYHSRNYSFWTWKILKLSKALFFHKNRLFVRPKTDVCQTSRTKTEPFSKAEHQLQQKKSPECSSPLQLKMTLKWRCRLGAWRAHRWSVFPAERRRDAARLMLSAFRLLKTLCGWVQFHLVGLITWVCRHMLVHTGACGGLLCACEGGNEKKQLIVNWAGGNSSCSDQSFVFSCLFRLFFHLFHILFSFNTGTTCKWHLQLNDKKVGIVVGIQKIRTSRPL